MKKYYYRFIAGALMFLPSIAFADPQNIPEGVGFASKKEWNTIYDILNYVVTLLLSVSAIIAVIFLIIGGLRYVISAGNADSVESAKNTILYSVIGLIIILLAYVIVKIVINLVGGQPEQFIDTPVPVNPQ
ncbi:MAG: hypothetical protein UU65_C0002G0189 [candidate division CPR2 bacterium GW2011_GWC1_41_48]|uniref:Uncharacterized protein n=1 Tax=candidate division CPR2 bacterium GW2011_GWC1_41_48 TaxID=1618344 RepID=A0A0G0YIN0_UNCC2|nr:MAG: hypothetical protein UT47_C0002G0115 [candidate division CPR2 bacterium GW2011_GWC2_39_35]KKS09411.1 MAG: hypothetical protein UU65_C0002G0189 [candidate division CPR2 bacterium GW2011_GWC1_41_48]